MANFRDIVCKADLKAREAYEKSKRGGDFVSFLRGSDPESWHNFVKLPRCAERNLLYAANAGCDRLFTGSDYFDVEVVDGTDDRVYIRAL